MANLVLSVSQMLVTTILEAKELWKTKSRNVKVLEELEHFIQDLRANIDDLKKKCKGAGSSNCTTAALDALEVQLQSALVDAKTIVREGFVKSLWDAKKTLANLQALHNRVTTYFQISLTYAAFHVSLENKQEIKSFKESMSKMNKMLLELYSNSVQRNENMLREEWKKASQPVMLELKKSNEASVAAVSMIRNTEPQTNETEEFFADVLEGLKHVTEQSNSTISETRDMSQLQWYQDPLTWETMCDPVKGTDGYTYDRWTFLRNAPSKTRSPLRGDIQTPFDIAMDDLSVRSRLFHEFPEQEARCKAEREAYKHEALQAARLECFGEAVTMLNNVLMWSPQDKECRSKLDDIQQQFDDANSSTEYLTETSLQATSSKSHAPVVNQEVRRKQSAAALKVDFSNHKPIGSIFPSVGNGAQVKLNLGHSPHKFSEEPYPTCLDRTTCDENHLVPSRDGLSLETKKNSGTFRAILADKPVPERTTFFYFDVVVEDCPPFSLERSIAIGFTGSDGFQKEGFPGYWKNSCGYQSGDKQSFIRLSQGTPLKLETPTGRHSEWHDAFMKTRIGAGIHYASKEILFVKNRHFIGAVGNSLIGKVMPAVAVRNNFKLNVKFGSRDNTCLQICQPSSFKNSSNDILRFKKKDNSGIVAFQADNVAPFHLDNFYFEITVSDSGKCGNITVGFCHHNHFRDDIRPGGYPRSCGYHGATGKLFTGSETGQEFVRPPFSKGDTVGAGISFKTNMILFVKNGEVIESIPNEMMSCAVYPVVSLGSVGEAVHFNFGKQPFQCKSPFCQGQL